MSTVVKTIVGHENLSCIRFEKDVSFKHMFADIRIVIRRFNITLIATAFSVVERKIKRVPILSI